MKKTTIRIWNVLLLVLAFATLMSMTAFAKAPKAPTLAKTVKMEAKCWDMADDTETYITFFYTVYDVTLPIKNLSKNAKIVNFGAEDNSILTDTCSIQLYKFKSKICARLYWNDYSIPHYNTRIPLTFKIKQNKKTYTLRTTLRPVYSTPYKTIKLNGKKVGLGGVVKGKVPTFTLPKDGKLKTIKTSLAKNYRHVAISVLRIANGQYTQYKYKKNFVLKKGDLLCLEYTKKGWRKGDTQYIFVR